MGADRGIAARGADNDGHYPVPPSGRVSNTSPNTLVPGQLNAAPIQCYCATAAYDKAVIRTTSEAPSETLCNAARCKHENRCATTIFVVYW
jgi:hypothetical protein